MNDVPETIEWVFRKPLVGKADRQGPESLKGKAISTEAKSELTRIALIDLAT
jgi:hypothetical protein